MFGQTQKLDEDPAAHEIHTPDEPVIVTPRARTRLEGATAWAEEEVFGTKLSPPPTPAPRGQRGLGVGRYGAGGRTPKGKKGGGMGGKQAS